MKRKLALVFAALAAFAAVVYAQPLVPAVNAAAASEGVNPWLVGLAVVAVAAIGYIVYLKRRDPAKLASLQASTTNELGKLLAAARADWSALRDSLDHNTAATAANTAANAPVSIAVSAPAADAKKEPTAVGKNGAAGVFTVSVTGDPKVDMPAISAAYFS